MEYRPRARLRALLEALGFFDTLSCYLSLIIKHSDTKWDNKKNIVDQILGVGGGGARCTFSKSATGLCLLMLVIQMALDECGNGSFIFEVATVCK